MNHNQKVRVEIGNRVYSFGKWKRKDIIYRGEKKIGIIKLTNMNRAGVTICLATSAKQPGRAIDWCNNSTP